MVVINLTLHRIQGKCAPKSLETMRYFESGNERCSWIKLCLTGDMFGGFRYSKVSY